MIGYVTACTATARIHLHSLQLTCACVRYQVAVTCGYRCHGPLRCCSSGMLAGQVGHTVAGTASRQGAKAVKARVATGLCSRLDGLCSRLNRNWMGCCIGDHHRLVRRRSPSHPRRCRPHCPLTPCLRLRPARSGRCQPVGASCASGVFAVAAKLLGYVYGCGCGCHCGRARAWRSMCGHGAVGCAHGSTGCATGRGPQRSNGGSWFACCVCSCCVSASGGVCSA